MRTKQQNGVLYGLAVVALLAGQVQAASRATDVIPGNTVGSVNLLTGTLGGSGEIGGDVHNRGGIVAPGNSPGTLIIDGDYTQGATGTLVIEIGGTLAGNEHDQVIISGAATA